MAYGAQGSGKDFCITGGHLNQGASNGKNSLLPFSRTSNVAEDERLQFKQREPGLIRLAFETVAA